MDDFFTWRESWRLDVEQLDRHHKALAGLLSSIARVYLSGEDRDELTVLLDKLYADTRQEFLDEERLMAETRYRGYSRHANEHAMLQAELKHCIRDIKAGKECLDMEMLSSLKSWFIGHITSSDKAFALHLLAHRSEGNIHPRDRIRDAHGA